MHHHRADIRATARFHRPIARRSLAFGCGIIFSASFAIASDRTLADDSDEGFVFRRIAVSGEAFVEQYVLKRCREFLNENREKKLVRYTLVPNQPNATFGLGGCDHCKAYPFWRMQYDAVTKEAFAIGEMIMLGGNAVVRYRDKDGSVHETVLAGSDPRPIVIGGFKGKIVHVGMDGKIRNPRTLWLQLFAAGEGAIESTAAANYIAEFSRQMGGEDASVELRSDPWFINEIWRTWLPLFEERRGAPPSEQEFNASKTLRCFIVHRPDGTSSNGCSWKSTTHLP